MILVNHRIIYIISWKDEEMTPKQRRIFRQGKRKQGKAKKKIGYGE